jgi:16S rRNA (adenine1518-N6/adenine1519-N6)-dimethyltransferase
MPSRQTASFLLRRFREAGFRLDARKGQNFLIDLNLVDLLIRTADLQEHDVVLEIGTGTGSLTAQMASRAAAVVTVEIDPHLHQLAEEELSEHSNVICLRQDALKGKNRLQPRVIEAVQEKLSETPGGRLKLVANLPYNIATPVISNLLSAPCRPVAMTATVQKEVADRIVAAPGTRDYGALSVWIQSQCRAEIVRVLPPDVFYPRPRVHSAIVNVVPEEELRSRLSDPEAFHAFLRIAFTHRRKVLRNVLSAAYRHRIDSSDFATLLARTNVSPNARAEELSVEALIELHDAIRQGSLN